MTEAGWTHEAPSKEGWYWMRAPKHGWRDCVMWVEKDEDGFYIDVGDCDSEYVADIDGEWLGPITPDSFQQGRAVAFKQGIEKLREREQFYTEQEAISEGEMRLTRGLQRNESSCCIHELEKLAQQAQEGGVGDAQ